LGNADPVIGIHDYDWIFALGGRASGPSIARSRYRFGIYGSFLAANVSGQSLALVRACLSYCWRSCIFAFDDMAGSALPQMRPNKTLQPTPGRAVVCNLPLSFGVAELLR
jgi:hypothetical protein